MKSRFNREVANVCQVESAVLKFLTRPPVNKSYLRSVPAIIGYSNYKFLGVVTGCILHYWVRCRYQHAIHVSRLLGIHWSNDLCDWVLQEHIPFTALASRRYSKGCSEPIRLNQHRWKVISDGKLRQPILSVSSPPIASEGIIICDPYGNCRLVILNDNHNGVATPQLPNCRIQSTENNIPLSCFSLGIVL